MNINSLVEKCQNFDDIVIKSGIQRDIQGFYPWAIQCQSKPNYAQRYDSKS